MSRLFSVLCVLGALAFALLILPGCATPGDAVAAAAKSAAARAMQASETSVDVLPGLPSAPSDASGVFVWGAFIGMGFVVLGILLVVASQHPAIGWIGTRKPGGTLAACGAALVVGSYALPRWGYLIENFIVQNAGILAMVAASAGALYLMRRVTWKTAFRQGQLEGKF